MASSFVVLFPCGFMNRSARSKRDNFSIASPPAVFAGDRPSGPVVN